MATYPSTPTPSYLYISEQEFRTMISEFDSGIEQRRKIRRFAKRVFNLTYKVISLTERNSISDFFRNRGGSYESFWLVDWASRKWVDEYVGRGIVIAPYKAFANDGGAFTDQTTAAGNATANDMTLLPAVPVVDDAYYFGDDSDKFDTVRINIGTAGVGTWTITWEYYNGAAWVSLSGISDGTTGFKTAGTNDVDWTRPSDWALTTVNGFSAYWVRARVSAYTSITTQPLGTQAWTGVREYDLHLKTSSGLTVYGNGIVVTPTTIVGGGEADVDRIRFNDPPVNGNLITCDGSGYLRIKGRFAEDNLKEQMETPSLFAIPDVKIKEVQW